MTNESISRRALLSGGMTLAGGLLLNEDADAAKKTRRVVVWSEGTAPKKVYPDDVNTAIAEGLKPLKGWEVLTANHQSAGSGIARRTAE